MKRLLILMTIFTINGISIPLLANLVYDPVLNLVMTKPESPEINQSEYRILVLDCAQIAVNIRSVNNNQQPSKTVLLAQYIDYLKRIGTPAALRLIEDLRKGKWFYPDGSVIREIFE